jgi:hypothetical protein
MSTFDVLDGDDLTPPCIGERFRDAMVDITHPSATALVVSLGAERLRRVATGELDERLVLDAIMECAKRRAATVRDVIAAKAAALLELRQGRSIAWAIQAGTAQLPVARTRARRTTSRPPSAG